MYGMSLRCEYVYGKSCVCAFSRPLPVGRVTKLGVLPTDTLAPRIRPALRYLIIVPRSLATPLCEGAVKLRPWCPPEPRDLIMSRGFGLIA